MWTCLFFTGIVFACLFVIYALFMLSVYSNVYCIYRENIVFIYFMLQLFILSLCILFLWFSVASSIFLSVPLIRNQVLGNLFW